MDHSFLRRFGLIIVLALCGAVTFAFLYDEVSPGASLDLKYSRSEIMEKAREYLVSLGYDLKDYQQDASLEFDGSTLLFLQSRFGMKRASEIVRADSLATHKWNVSWYDRSAAQSQTLESFTVWVSPSGRFLGFDHLIRDSIAKTSIGRSEAQTLARQFLERHGVDLSGYYLKSSSDTRLPNRIDYRFVFATRDSTADDLIRARVQGDEVGGYRLLYGPGAEFQRSMSRIGTLATFFVTASYAAAFILFFFIVILFLKKYHEGEVGTRTALMVFIGLLLILVLSVVNRYHVLGTGVQVGDLNKSNVRIVVLVFSVFIVQLFLSVMVFAAWSVGESSSRSTWPMKLRAADSALFRRFFTLDTGEGLLRGYCWGLIVLGAYTGVLYFLVRYFRVGMFGQGAGGLAEAYVPAIQPVLAAAGIAVFSEIVFRLFFISYLREKTGKTWLGVIVSSVIWMVSMVALWELPYGFLRLEYTYVAMFVFGIVFSLLFIRYDLLTAITANFLIVGLAASIPLLSSTGASFHATHWVLLCLIAVPVVIAAVGFVKRQRFEFTPETVPAHIKRISERERMAKELEIARKVQLSLLPKVNPVVPGYDIAGICIPALEVGGDYYDFVNLGSKKIGIAIGDVSGKGVPAAIYMTLTKGILQSHAEGNVSPKRVLSKVNSLMFRTIDRNSFVSMFYAVLDIGGKTIRFSRAGQCPVIVAQRTGKRGTFLTPKGMALGLEMGKVFDSVLEERELKLRSGEVLVFYTDGFTEAMNSEGEEYGEQRLVDVISKHRTKPAADIILSICSEVESYIDDTPQHDDMTMVVLKVA